MKKAQSNTETLFAWKLSGINPNKMVFDVLILFSKLNVMVLHSWPRLLFKSNSSYTLIFSFVFNCNCRHYFLLTAFFLLTLYLQANDLHKLKKIVWFVFNWILHNDCAKHTFMYLFIHSFIYLFLLSNHLTCMQKFMIRRYYQEL